jgi:hypothetical protein
LVDLAGSSVCIHAVRWYRMAPFSERDHVGNSPGQGHRPLTKAELLPLPSARVRAVSLENHLALAALRTAAGSHVMGCLLRVVYLAWYLREACPRVHMK